MPQKHVLLEKLQIVYLKLEDSIEEICNKISMKKIIIILLLPFNLLSQNIEEIFNNKNEIYFSFKYKSKQELDRLSKIISLDHKIEKTTAYAYANKKQFIRFLELNIDFELINNKVFYQNVSKSNWDYYPTYNQYVDMMYAFADSFPNICKVHSLGTPVTIPYQDAFGGCKSWVELDNSLELEQNPVLSPSELTSIIDSIKTILK